MTTPLRPQQYRITWPLTPNQVEGIDTMFETLFKRLRAVEQGASASSSTGGDFDHTTVGTVVGRFPWQAGGDGDDGERGIQGSQGATGPQGPMGLPGQDGDDGGSTDIPYHIPASINTKWTQGSVVFAGPSGMLAQNNSNFFWDNTNNELGIGTAIPQTTMHINTDGAFSSFSATLKNSSIDRLYLTSTANSNTTFALFNLSSNAGQSAIINFRRLKGSYDTPTSTASGDEVGLILGTAYDGSVLRNSASIDFILDGGVASGVVPQALTFSTGTSSRSERVRISSGGLVGIGQTSPSAILHLKAGTATASTAPLKFASGTSLTSAEAGAVEFTTDDLFFTITTGAARKGFILNDGSNLTSGQIPKATTNGRLINGYTASALTKTDDTNVTLTLGGTPATALLNAASITVGWTGTLGLARGGTHADLSSTGGSNQFLKQSSSGAAITVGTIGIADLPTLTSHLSADFSASTTTTLADSGLTVTLASSTTYEVELVLPMTLDGTGGGRVSLTGSATITNMRVVAQFWNNTGSSIQGTQLSALGGFNTFGGGGATDFVVIYTGVIEVNAGGTLKLQFAQASASGTSKVLRDAKLKATPIS